MSRVKCVGIVKTPSLPRFAEGETEQQPGSMKNDDAALVKEMKSGLAAREEAEGWKTERSTGNEAVYCLRSRSRTKKRGLIRCGSEITVGRFEK